MTCSSKKILLSIISVFIFLFCTADGVDEVLPKTPFTKKYVKGVHSKIGISADYKVNFTNFALLDDDYDRRFTYYPNLRGVISLGVRYKIFRLSYSFNFRSNDNYDEFYGPTEFNNFEFGIKTRSVWLQLYFSRYKGFYYSEENMIFPRFELDSVFPQNNNLSSLEIGLRANIIFNRDFSMVAAFDYSEIQTSSAGSFFIMVNPKFSNIISENSPLIPTIYSEYYTGFNNFNKAIFISIATGLGYGYALVIGPVNFANAVVAGPNLQMYFQEGVHFKLPYDLYFKSSLSLNFENFYTGVMASYDVNNHVFGKNNIRKQILCFTGRLGVRF